MWVLSRKAATRQNCLFQQKTSLAIVATKRICVNHILDGSLKRVRHDALDAYPSCRIPSAMYRILLLALVARVLFSAGFQSSDLLKLRSVASVQFSPDGSKIAYTVSRNDVPR